MATHLQTVPRVLDVLRPQLQTLHARMSHLEQRKQNKADLAGQDDLVPYRHVPVQVTDVYAVTGRHPTAIQVLQGQGHRGKEIGWWVEDREFSNDSADSVVQPVARLQLQQLMEGFSPARKKMQQTVTGLITLNCMVPVVLLQTVYKPHGRQ